MTMRRLILASASPRRREILNTVGMPHTVIVSDYDEHETSEGLSAKEKVIYNSVKKGESVALRCGDDDIVISCDTVVELDGRILEKPVGESDAASMLRTLSGKTHSVWTGLTVIDRKDGSVFTEADRADVSFCEMSEEEISWYIGTGEPMDKAGSYGIQGYGARFIKGIRGNYHTVMGLPSQLLYSCLHKKGVL